MRSSIVLTGLIIIIIGALLLINLISDLIGAIISIFLLILGGVVFLYGFLLPGKEDKVVEIKPKVIKEK
ncbi:hypothetical protein AYK26_06135 [Euryarchaeota archaeon SM23-78]|nr:MAG: hypothetical protein AYK26_06135 [Euryarchaeota archaeon SM23-78]MBW3001502.1 hypothetical protein [Candidatus Woesearchaeota archaeon]